MMILDDFVFPRRLRPGQRPGGCCETHKTSIESEILHAACSRLSSDIDRVWLLASKRSAWFMVGFCSRVGTAAFRAGNESEYTPFCRRQIAQSRLTGRSETGAECANLISFTGQQALAIAEGFGKWAATSGAKILACAILPEHVHLVVARHRFPIEQVANLLKGRATKSLSKAGLHPFQSQPYPNGILPSPWGHKFWKVFLTTDEDIWRAIRYVENNPLKEGKRRQQWPFVVSFQG